ncbi:hypothetical protein A8990_14143 [Paenibacillus taihuensis]|uniref:Uncharacterized protein n=1 Tax=Paenibacillus taihuensis TaxID=1156355 RepID=A0A3D9R1B9_9BACL|nr:hypothetical protein [Paenibacillus taihuensis]REE67682.1 hypothetical protein A8990_14143 [Paenibacillus taihuensis]
MERAEAEALADWMQRYSEGAAVEGYDVTRISSGGAPLQGFHQWANGKALVNAFHVSRPLAGGGALYVLFIDWHRNDNYYLVLYAGDKSTTHAEIQKLVYDEAGRPSHLRWTYNPLKRDGGNAVRKAYFKQQWGELAVTIPVLGALREDEIEHYLEALFDVVDRRLRADRAPELYGEMDEM